jgi:hypothetical protein
LAPRGVRGTSCAAPHIKRSVEDWYCKFVGRFDIDDELMKKIQSLPFVFERTR